MKRIWAPWRIEYIRKKDEKGCIFCDKPKMNDRNELILSRGESVFTLMNLYPYTNGHLLVSPFRHIDSFRQLEQAEKLEILEQIDKSVDVLTKIMNPDGFNVGANIGSSAGAGIEDHIHFHVVPRWNGDTNFMPVLVHTKVMVEGLEESWSKMKPYFDRKNSA
tara:strand:- start:164 stop:652 length:489 start_codon:yes stop_codon:yes gene_type:complete